MTTTNTAAPALLPCPFCGGTNLSTENARDFISCLDCHAEGPMPLGMGMGDIQSAAAWNRRTALEQPAASEPEPRAAGPKDQAVYAAIAANYHQQPAASGAPDELQRLQTLVQQMQRVLIRVETDWTDGHGGAFEDGEMGAMDDVRAALAGVPADLRPVGYVLRYGALDGFHADHPQGLASMEPHDTAEAARAAGEACGFNYEVLPVFRGAALTAAPAAQPATCPTCSGNDADAPCAYPGQRAPGCLRDKRLAGAAPAAAQPAAPKGWKLVPVEPTPEMIDAYSMGVPRVLPAYVGAKEKADARIAERYRAMIAAAPAGEQQHG